VCVCVCVCVCPVCCCTLPAWSGYPAAGSLLFVSAAHPGSLPLSIPGERGDPENQETPRTLALGEPGDPEKQAKGD